MEIKRNHNIKWIYACQTLWTIFNPMIKNKKPNKD